MDSKSSDGDSKDGSNSDLELTDLMETATDVTESSLGKRKAETTTDESGESEKNSTGDEESEEFDDTVSRNQDSSGSELKWGYDSFDDREDDSSDTIVDPNDEVEMQWHNCHRLIIETKGFFEVTDEFPPCVYSGIGALGDLDAPAMEGVTVRQLCEKLTCLCLDRFNYDEKKSVKFHHIIRVNFNPGSVTKFYITFAARESDSPGAPCVEYQAKAAYSVRHKSYPILCRPSPPLRKTMEAR